MKYSIQVWFDGDWLHFTELKDDDIRVMTWDSFEEAEKVMKEMFKALDRVRIVAYKEEGHDKL